MISKLMHIFSQQITLPDGIQGYLGFFDLTIYFTCLHLHARVGLKSLRKLSRPYSLEGFSKSSESSYTRTSLRERTYRT